MKVKKLFFRWLFYIIGMVLLATSLAIYTKTGLGVSAMMSVPVAVSDIWQLNLGNVTLLYYVLIILIQMALHIRQMRKTGEAGLAKYLIMDALQFPLSLVFTRVLNFVSRLVPVFGEAYSGQFLGSFWGRIVMLLVAVIVTGIGAAMMLNMRLIPNPSDGIVHSFAVLTKKKVGFTKNWIDLVSICISLAIGLIATGQLVALGVGTVISAVGIGRVMDLFNRFCKKKMCELAGL